MDDSIEKIEEMYENVRTELISQVCSVMEQRYNRKFVISNMIASIGDASVILHLHPEDDLRLMIKASMDRDGNIEENYVSAGAVQPLRNFLERSLPGIAVNAIVIDDGEPETDTGLDLPGFLHKHGPGGVLLNLSIDDSIRPENDILIDTIQEAGKTFQTDLVVYVFIYSHDHFKQAKELTETLPSVSDTLLSDLDPVSEIKMFVKDGICAATHEEPSAFQEMI